MRHTYWMRSWKCDHFICTGGWCRQILGHFITVWGHAASNWVLASSITSKPCKLGLFTKLSLSAIGLPGADASNTEPSQPSTYVRSSNQFPRLDLIVTRNWYILICIRNYGLELTLTKQSWKCILMSPAAMPALSEIALFTVLLTISSADGHAEL